MLHFLLQISIHAWQCDDIISECSAPLMTAIHAGQCDDITWLFWVFCPSDNGSPCMVLSHQDFHTWPVTKIFFWGGGVTSPKHKGGVTSPKHKFHIQSHKKNKTKTPLSLPEVFHTHSWVPWNQIVFWPKRPERNKSATQEVLFTTFDVIVHLTPRNICLIIQKHFVSFLVKQLVLGQIHRSTALTPNTLCVESYHRSARPHTLRGGFPQKCRAPQTLPWRFPQTCRAPQTLWKVSTEERSWIQSTLSTVSLLHVYACACNIQPTVSLPTGPPPSLLPLVLL